MYGSYLNIEGGDPAVALKDLTGAPVDTLDDFEDLDVLWNFIHQAELNKWIITCYTKSHEGHEHEHEQGKCKEERNALGIVEGHAYSILDSREVQTETGVERIIKIRNPWGSYEWNGDWSDKSSKWTSDLKN